MESTIGRLNDKLRKQLEANRYGLLAIDDDANYQIEPHEEPINVIISLKDKSIHKFGNITEETFYNHAGGFYSVTSQFKETYIFPMNSINYIKKWSSKEEVSKDE